MVLDMTEIEEYRLTKDQALIINDQIKSTIQELEDLLSEFISGEGWLALGYETAWDWWSKEVGQKRLGSSTRKIVDLQFSKEDVPIKTSARALGVSKNTIKADRGQIDPTSPESTLIEPTEILPPEVDEKTAEELEAEFRELLETNRSVLEPSVPYDITPDKAVTLAIDSSSGWMEMAVRVSKKDISSNTRAKIRIELQIMRDMIDMIEENL
jgi:hypothetical protein